MKKESFKITTETTELASTSIEGGKDAVEEFEFGEGVVEITDSIKDAVTSARNDLIKERFGDYDTKGAEDYANDLNTVIRSKFYNKTDNSFDQTGFQAFLEDERAKLEDYKPETVVSSSRLREMINDDKPKSFEEKMVKEEDQDPQTVDYVADQLGLTKEEVLAKASELNGEVSQEGFGGIDRAKFVTIDQARDVMKSLEEELLEQGAELKEEFLINPMDYPEFVKHRNEHPYAMDNARMLFTMIRDEFPKRLAEQTKVPGDDDRDLRKYRMQIPEVLHIVMKNKGEQIATGEVSFNQILDSLTTDSRLGLQVKRNLDLLEDNLEGDLDRMLFDYGVDGSFREMREELEKTGSIMLDNDGAVLKIYQARVEEALERITGNKPVPSGRPSF